ncbi:MAG TPA: signal peptidase II [Candidatus Limosilactobacillus merdipullorum]|uniref:Lipoprotein signal peptidase n=1 Tax=Candidatus Limosilactobacillus merdipullorum TaxID=2838653 RepID=A0A9D1U3G6_9LACO|nr:signal peptidase II [Candidatus Limosilactobacillus merdipullorum]
MIYVLLTVVLMVIDQVIKWLVTAHLSVNQTTTMIPGIFDLTNLHNTGAAWSMLEGQQWFFIIITIVALVVIAWLMRYYRGRRWPEISLCLILAGTLGNFIDRLRLGYVVDMFELVPVNFPVFNFADSLLTIGVILLAIQILKEDD